MIDAARAGRFHIYPVETIDQGIEVMTDLPAGAPDEEGKYPPESFNGRVYARLMDMAEKRIAFGRKMQGEKKEDAS